MLNFDLPKNQSSIIKVIGVGGGGSNAVTHMYRQGIKGVDFIICNTDAQAMEASPVPTKIQLGAALTSGLGAGAVPSVGKNAALENIEDIRAILEKNTKMLFITVGLGGGTGTGAAPVIASVARELGILTVAIVTMPFSFEGRKRKQHAEEGITELKKQVDAVLIINNDKLRELYGNLTLRAAFGHADDVLTTAAKGIAELITVTGHINVDFEDVRTVMKDSGVAIMGVGIASGERRAAIAIEQAMCSPLLNDDNVEGANNILLYIISGTEEITMDEVSEITEYIQDKTKSFTEVIWGNGIDESLEDKISVTVIATGFDEEHANKNRPEIKPGRIIHTLDGHAAPVVEEPKIVNQEQPSMEMRSKLMRPQFTEIRPKPVEIVRPEPVVSFTSEPMLFESASVQEEIFQEPVDFTLPEQPVAKEEISIPESYSTPPLQEDEEEQIQPEEIKMELEDVQEEPAFVREPAQEPVFTSQRILEFEVGEAEQHIANFETNFQEETPEVSYTREVLRMVESEAEPEMAAQVNPTIEEDSSSEMDRMQRERRDILKSLSVKLKHPANLENELHEIESVPAYKRRNVTLNDTIPSSENQMPKYSVPGNPENRSNPINENQYLHNKPD